jgi:hypothetical protein
MSLGRNQGYVFSTDRKQVVDASHQTLEEEITASYTRGRGKSLASVQYL